MIATFITYLHYSYVRYAVIVGVLIALCSALIGVTLVLKRFSFIGDGLSHVAFGAMAVASVMHLTNDMLLILPVTIAAAVLLLRTGRKTRVNGDAAIAMVSVGAMAFGYLIMNIFPVSANLSGDVCTTLFGSMSILTLSRSDVWVCTILSLAVIVLFVLFYNRIFDVTFDEDFARASGNNVDRLNLLIAVIIAVIIVLAMNLVGALLISALVVFPALSAMRIFDSFRSVTIFSAALSVCCALFGMIISVVCETPVGSTIVAVDAAAFFVCWLVGALRRGKRPAAAPLVTVLLIAVLLCSCGAGDSKASAGQETVAPEAIEEEEDGPADIAEDLAEEPGTEDVYLDLSPLNSTMTVAELFNMAAEPDEYVGKTIRLKGTFVLGEDEDGSVIYGCLNTDATQCCTVVVQIIPKEQYRYPDDFPEEEEEIIVEGVFDIATQGQFQYLMMTDVDILN